MDNLQPNQIMALIGFLCICSIPLIFGYKAYIMTKKAESKRKAKKQK